MQRKQALLALLKLFSIDALRGPYNSKTFRLACESDLSVANQNLKTLGEQELDITRICSLLPFSVKEFLSVKDLTI